MKIRAFIQVKIWQIAFRIYAIAKLFYLQCSLSFKDKNNHKKYKSEWIGYKK
jgi:hypothetical protein